MIQKSECDISLFDDSDNEIQALVNDYVLSHPLGSIYHHSAWRNAIRSAYLHRTIVFIAKDQQKIVGILPLCVMSVPIFGSSLVALPYADYGGVLADEDEVAAQLVAEAKRQLRQLKANKLELRSSELMPQHSEQIWLNAQATEPEPSKEPVKARMLVRLPANPELLLAGYKPKLRSQIKKAQKNGLDAEIKTDLDSLNHFYSIYTKNMHRLGSPVHSLDWFVALRQNLITQDAFKIVLIKYQEQIVGAGIILHFGESAWLPWASTLKEYNHLAPNMLLYWQIQAYLSEIGVKVFDMGRSTIGEGTYRFKAQWGAIPVPLSWTTFGTNARSETRSVNSNSSRLRRVAETIWRALPFPVATACGAYLRRYISL